MISASEETIKQIQYRTNYSKDKILDLIILINEIDMIKTEYEDICEKEEL